MQHDSEIEIKIGTIEQAHKLSLQIPEFHKPYSIETYLKRLKSNKNLILLAYCNKKPAGFKIGYQLNDECFYSWLGGVLPACRKKHIASKLIIKQEAWAKANRFIKIRVKTRNCFRGMLQLLIKHYYQIEAIEPKSDINQNRIIFIKYL